VRWGDDDAVDTAPAAAVAVSPAVKAHTAIRSRKKTSTLLAEFHAEQVEEMLSGKFSKLEKQAIMKKLDEEFPIGYEFRDERHVFECLQAHRHHPAQSSLQTRSQEGL
jgi:hypothetical protein